MARAPEQSPLFDASASLPGGFIYRPSFVSEAEEAELIAHVVAAPLQNAEFGQYTARRQVANFGWGWDFDIEGMSEGPPLPAWLSPYRRRIAKWLDIREERIVEALVTKYEPGTPIGWHRDRGLYDIVIGLSLSGWSVMRLRPMDDIGNRAAVTPITLEPRSAYVLRGESRWNYQHSIRPTTTLRYSITFRTLPPQVYKSLKSG